MQWREIAYQAATVVSALTAWGLQQTSAQAALLVGNTAGNNVLIFDERTGKLGGEFIGAGSGGLTSPDDLTFGFRWRSLCQQWQQLLRGNSAL
ncbi:hypothetical protein [Trichocoleus sp. FACHB-262]|uniref:hypothetical protein n=1 Tax=Trichocoleus sp. FACHB-262 TaxID=2692869 RepID=UPI001681C4EF|nr:hypothetical protein [Trichocoleus sp. FACHB-262]MBD2122003.1 hypothetical protein [Trichocoleus sp. FACHB-262]